MFNFTAHRHATGNTGDLDAMLTYKLTYVMGSCLTFNRIVGREYDLFNESVLGAFEQF